MTRNLLMLGVAAAIAGMAAGCGPLFSPMIPRLSPDTQASVDDMWHNMLTPPQRTSRQTLLDTLCSYFLFTYGIDRAAYHAEKLVDGNLVLMDVAFDRARPQFDSFTLAVYGPDGDLLRHERYTRADVQDALGPGGIPGGAMVTTRPTATRPLTAEELAAMKLLEYRIAAVAAATQPASQPPATGDQPRK